MAGTRAGLRASSALVEAADRGLELAADLQELTVHVADALAACVLPLSLAEHRPLLCAALPDSDGVLRARW